MTAALVATHLTKRYGDRTVVDDVSFEVARGEVVGFLGPNGAGKTTTLRMLTGFLAPTSGGVTVDGIDLAREPERARGRFGYMPEGAPMHPELRASEYLAYRAALKGVPRRRLRDEVARCLAQAGVEEAATRILGQLSKGTRQRVALADALLGDPPILVLDEPTSGLDPNQMRHVRALVRSMARDKTIFLSTHILPEVEATCDRVVIVRGGRLVAEGTPDTLRAQASATARYVVRTRSAPAALADVLAATAGVRSVTVEDARCVVETDAGEGDLDAVVDAIAAAGLGLRELRPLGGLEEVFAELTVTEPDAPVAPTEAA